MLPFWERVDYVIKKKKLTLSWLAQESGQKLNTIKGWKQKNLHPRTDEAETIARVLEVSIDYLQTGRVIETIDDPDLEDICSMLRDMDRDELMMAKGMLFSMKYSAMKPKRERAVNE